MKEDLEINSRLRLLPCLSGLSNKELGIITEHAKTRKVPNMNTMAIEDSTLIILPIECLNDWNSTRGCIKNDVKVKKRGSCF